MRKILVSVLFFICVLMINASASEIVYVNCNGLNVRVSPTTESDIVQTVPNGSQLEVIYTDNGWHNVRMSNGVTGFVNASYVTKAVGSQLGAQIAQTAQKFIGCTYSYGASGPNAFDCSGLTSYVYKQHGLSLPRTSNSQGSCGSYIDKSNLAVGDLVFFSNRSDRSINHVGIYVGDNKFVHASTSTRGVVMDNITSSYYVRHYVTARRVL